MYINHLMWLHLISNTRLEFLCCYAAITKGVSVAVKAIYPFNVEGYPMTSMLPALESLVLQI